MFGKNVVIKLIIVKIMFTQNPTQMSYYRIHHGGKAPQEFVLTNENPNASMYEFCYKDVPAYNNKYVVQFHSYVY